MNVAIANPPARFNALLVDGDGRLEGTIHEAGCSVQRASSLAAALEALPETDVLVIAASSLLDDEVLALIKEATAADQSVLVLTTRQDLAVRAASAGAAIVVGHAIELVSAQIKQLLTVVDLKRKIARQSSSPSSGIVQRRSAPLPKEATPDALDALIRAAEGLMPMHKFQRVYVDYALRRFGGNKVHTAAALGIDRRTIQRWARSRDST